MSQLHDTRKWRAKNADKFRAYRKKYNLKILLQRFGLTLEWWTKECERGCAICGSHVMLCLDHNHDTGQVRGVLCKKCNSGIGLLRDDPSLCRQAALYLERLVPNKPRH